MYKDTIPIEEYLSRKGIQVVKEAHGELIVKCVFNDCDKDSRSSEAHLYFSKETGRYHCKKCDATGNIITLVKHFGDDPKLVMIDDQLFVNKQVKQRTIKKEKFQKKQMSDEIRAYLNARGISDQMTDQYKIESGAYCGADCIAIRVWIPGTEDHFCKLRLAQGSSSKGSKYLFDPQGSSSTLFGLEYIDDPLTVSDLWICEGEFDAMLLLSRGINAVTSTAGANTFKEEWFEYIKEFKNLERIHLCFDNDDVGKNGASTLVKRLESVFSDIEIYNVEFFEEMNGKDVTDFFTKNNGTKMDLYNLAVHVGGPEPVDVSKFEPISSKEVISALDATVKNDNENKLVAFLCMLSAYTEDSQFNISFNAPSSSGKSYIPLEVAQLFPREDVMEIGYCTPTAFFHENGVMDKVKKSIVIDLTKKIIIFLDQPSTYLLERLRPLLSHDTKEMKLKITDKAKGGGNKTKNVIIKGFPAVIFCSAGLQIDEQEGTRFLLLSPQIDQEKIRAAILEKIKHDSNKRLYREMVLNNEDRNLLKDRVRGVKRAGIKEVIIPDTDAIESAFLGNKDYLKPRHQRDIGRLMNLVKMFALLNLWFREVDDGVLIANSDDVREALEVWSIISESQEYNLPPYVYDLYKNVILVTWHGKQEEVDADEPVGISRQEIQMKHYELLGRSIADWTLRQQILPMLEASGLIIQEYDYADRRKKLVFPAEFYESEIVGGKVVQNVDYHKLKSV